MSAAGHHTSPAKRRQIRPELELPTLVTILRGPRF
jgi:hypothetical protein